MEGIDPMEMVPPPAAGRFYETEMTAAVTDVNGAQRLRLDGIARLLQEVARQDLADAGFEGRGVWIVRKTRIAVTSFPLYGEALSVSTFCSGIGRFSAERRTTLTGDRGAIEAVSRWICFDPTGSRPQRFDDEYAGTYEETAAGRGANVRVRHPNPPEGAEGEPWVFRASDLDIAGHVNNSHYWVPWEQDWLDGPEPTGFDGEVEHRDAALPGPAVLVRGEGASWILSPSGGVHASLVSV